MPVNSARQQRLAAARARFGELEIELAFYQLKREQTNAKMNEVSETISVLEDFEAGHWGGKKK